MNWPEQMIVLLAIKQQNLQNQKTSKKYFIFISFPQTC